MRRFCMRSKYIPSADRLDNYALIYRFYNLWQINGKVFAIFFTKFNGFKTPRR